MFSKARHLFFFPLPSTTQAFISKPLSPNLQGMKPKPSLQDASRSLRNPSDSKRKRDQVQKKIQEREER
jgi:hypothetical protein